MGGNKTIRVPPTREETERENRKFFESQKKAAKKKGQVKFQEPSPKTRTREKGQQEVITKKRKRMKGMMMKLIHPSSQVNQTKKGAKGVQPVPPPSTSSTPASSRKGGGGDSEQEVIYEGQRKEGERRVDATSSNRKESWERDPWDSEYERRDTRDTRGTFQEMRGTRDTRDTPRNTRDTRGTYRDTRDTRGTSQEMRDTRDTPRDTRDTRGTNRDTRDTREVLTPGGGNKDLFRKQEDRDDLGQI